MRGLARSTIGLCPNPGSFLSLSCEAAAFQRFAFQEGHRDEGLTVGFGGLVDGADVGVMESSGSFGLTQKPLLRLIVVEQVLREKLERDGTVERGVLSLVDDAHAALAELLDDAVVADRGADDRDAAIVALCGG